RGFHPGHGSLTVHCVISPSDIVSPGNGRLQRLLGTGQSPPAFFHFELRNGAFLQQPLVGFQGLSRRVCFHSVASDLRLCLVQFLRRRPSLDISQFRLRGRQFCPRRSKFRS